MKFSDKASKCSNTVADCWCQHQSVITLQMLKDRENVTNVGRFKLAGALWFMQTGLWSLNRLRRRRPVWSLMVVGGQLRAQTQYKAPLTLAFGQASPLASHLRVGDQQSLNDWRCFFFWAKHPKLRGPYPVLSCFLFFFSFFKKKSTVMSELRWTVWGINNEVEYKSGRLKMERQRAQGTRCVGHDLLNSVWE